MTTATYVDFYDILDIPETASDSEINAAIKKQRQLWTKRQGLSDLAKRQQAEKRVHDLTEAERVLLNPQRRNEFNQQRKTARPESVPLSGDGGTDWIARAREHLQLGQMSAANFAAREALNTNGGNHELWSIRAESAFNLGDWREAEFSYQEAIRIKPDQVSYHFDLGCAFEGVGNFGQALQKFEDSLRLEPGNPIYKAAIAGVYLETGAAPRALPMMEEIVREHPENEAFQFYLAWALADSCSSYTTTVEDGFFITSKEQVDRMRSDLNRAKALKFDEKGLRDHIDERLEMVTKAEKMTWNRPSFSSFFGRLWAVAFIVGLLLIQAKGLGVLVVGVLGYAYVKLYRIPTWKDSAKFLKKTKRVTKWGIGHS